MVSKFILPEEQFTLSRIEKLNFIQDSAVESCLHSNRNTLCLATGVGKTITAFKYLYELRKAGKLQDELVWFMAETTTRERTLIEESTAYEQIFGTNPLKDFNLKFHCYQAKPVGAPYVIIADEIHESLTPKYQEVYENNASYVLGLSATIPRNLRVHRDDETNELTKGELLASIAPMSFYYPLSSAISDGILSPYHTTVIEHGLDEVNQTIANKTKTKQWMSTEAKYFSYRNMVMGNPRMTQFYKQHCARQMCRMLWNLPSKADVIKALLPTLTGKTIIFGVELSLLESITDNVVRGGGKAQESKNTKLIDDFNAGRISVIAAAKKLKQGITLEGVTNCIIVSYYKESWHAVQQLGRIVRFVPGKQANLYIMRTARTYETKWFDNLNKIKDEKGNVVETIDLNIVDHILSQNIRLYERA